MGERIPSWDAGVTGHDGGGQEGWESGLEEFGMVSQGFGSRSGLGRRLTLVCEVDMEEGLENGSWNWAGFG
jgi:hypothetical protein